MDFFGCTWIREACLAQRLGFLLVIWGHLPLAAQSAEVLNTSVVRQEERFIMHSEALVQAPVADVRRIFTDYENLLRINPDIKRVEVLERLHNVTVHGLAG